MITRIHFFSVVIISTLFCIPIPAQKTNTAKNTAFLGTLVQSKKMWYNKDYAVSSAIDFDTKMLLTASSEAFTDKTYKQYKKAVVDQGKTVFFEYNDSIAEKPTYITLKFADKVALISQLYSDQNRKLVDYVANSKQNALVNEVSVLVQQPIYDQILYAEKVFLQTSKNGLLALCLQNGDQVKDISLSQLQTFSISTARFCWMYDENTDSIKINDLIEKGQSCPKGSKTHPRKLTRKKQENYNRF